MGEVLRIGVVGFSQRHFDQEAARDHLRRRITPLVADAARDGSAIEIVSGLTNQGVPALAYELARELGVTTVGISAKQALRASAGVFPVDRRILVGKRYGDESAVFIASIDTLVRIGGGPQSRREVELFRAKLEAEGQTDADTLARRLFEVEVDWYGRR
jgi:hypothetical protein